LIRFEIWIDSLIAFCILSCNTQRCVHQSVTFRFRNFSVSKLFHFFDGFGFGIEKIWYRKKYWIRYRKNLVSEKVSDSVSEKFGIGKSFGFSIIQILGILGDVSFSKVLGIETFPFFRWFRIRYRKNLVSKKVSDSVSKKFSIEKSIGFGIGKIWYRKKVSDSVSFRFLVSSHTGVHLIFF